MKLNKIKQEYLAILIFFFTIIFNKIWIEFKTIIIYIMNKAAGFY